jgi:hypothetical protein
VYCREKERVEKSLRDILENGTPTSEGILFFEMPLEFLHLVSIPSNNTMNLVGGFYV